MSFVLAHGKSEQILTKDNVLEDLSSLLESIRRRKTLANKPKLFFVQIWNDEKEFTHGANLLSESFENVNNTEILNITVDGDFLCYCFEGPKSRMYLPQDSNQNGSILIQALCNAIRTEPQKELAPILRLTNAAIKQQLGIEVPEIDSALAKQFYFRVSKSDLLG